MYKTTNGESISIEKINLKISNFIFEVIENHIPYIWFSIEQPFFNVYSDKISYDYSGDVKPATKEDIINIGNELGKDEDFDLIYNSLLDELLSKLYINEWIPSYVSNSGKNWISYMNILRNKYLEWTSENFKIYDNDNEDYYDEKLELELEDILNNFLENTDYMLYFKKILFENDKLNKLRRDKECR